MNGENLSKADSYRKMALVLVALSLVSYLVKFGFNIFLARYLDKGLYGDFIIGLKTFTLVSALLLLGTGTASKRFLASYLKRSDEKNVVGYLAWNLHLVFIAGVIFLIFLFITTLLLMAFHLFDMQRFESYHLAMYMLFIAPLGVIALLFASYLQRNNNVYWYSFLIRGARFWLFSFLFLVATYFMELALDLPQLWGIILLAYLILILFESVLLFLRMPRGLLGNTLNALKTKKNKIYDASWKKTSSHLIFNQVIFLLLTVIDLYIVEIFDPQEMAVDHYAAVSVISGVIWIIAIGISQFIAPMVSHSLEAGNHKELQKAIDQGNAVNGIVIAIIFSAILSYGQLLLGIFGPHYLTAASYSALAIMSLGYFIGTFSGSSVLLLSYSGHEKCLTKISAVELSTLTILCVILTIRYGIVGAAMASSISILIKTIYFVRVAKSKLKLKPLSIL
jgi:O-antigen/teichoic acid export membrane protein